MGTDRKQFDMFFDKMRDSFAYHKIVVDKAGKPVDYVFLEVNSAFEKMTGLKREQIIGKKVTEVLFGIEKDPADWIGVYGRVALTGEPAQFESHTEPLGKWYKVVAYCPEKGHFVALFEDITERKKAEEALRQSEERFRNVFEHTALGIAIGDLGGRVVESNSALERMLGYSKEELHGKLFSGFTHSNDVDLVLSLVEEVKAGKHNHYEIEKRYIRKNGEIIWVHLAGSLILGPNKEPFMGIATVEDITERKKAEEALREANENLEARVIERTKEVLSERQRLYSILETLPAYVILLDKDYRVPFANKVFRERFGESHGRRCYEYLFNRDSPCENCETYKVLKNTKSHHWEWTGPDCRDYDIYDFTFVEPDGSTLILEMGIDITERKKAEAMVEESARKLKDAERLAAIGATAGMVGHDIRNPLQAITSDVYLAKTDLAQTPESEEKKNALESLDEIEKNVVYINKIVADLQDYARPLKPVAKETNLQKIINELLTKNGVPENVKVQVKVQKEAGTLMADSDILKRILGNLVTNAVQAMPEGGKLTIQAYKEANDSVITVADTGVGIPEEAKSKLFTPLFTTKSKGQGFGLAVVKRMTEALGGTVTFESEEGKGTKFIIRLPAQ